MEATSNQNGINAFASGAQQYLTFRLGGEDYGIDILKVQEIKGFSSVTRVPRAPEYIRGVMNLRGTIVPIVDLRTRFGLEQAEYDQFTVIIVVVVRGRQMGLVVDAVSDVLDLPEGDIVATPEFSTRVDTRFIHALGRTGDRLVILLDVQKLLDDEELHIIEGIQG